MTTMAVALDRNLFLAYYSSQYALLLFGLLMQFALKLKALDFVISGVEILPVILTGNVTIIILIKV